MSSRSKDQSTALTAVGKNGPRDLEDAGSSDDEESTASTSVLYILIVCFVTCGTFSTIMSKIMYQTQGTGRFGETEYFSKPLFQNWAMFLAMTGCLVIFEVRKCMRGPATEEEKAMLKNGQKPAGSDPRIYYIAIIPAACDFIATYLMAVGLLWINASIWQMIRGSLVFFSAMIRYFALGKGIEKYQWFGISMVMTALVVIGFACIEGTSASSSTSTPTQKAMGIALVFLAQMIQATQTVIEEYLLKDVNAVDLQIVGLEGLWGFILCTFVAMPFCQFVGMEGIHEDSWDTFYLVVNNPKCLIEAAIYVSVILGFNIFAMKITSRLNSVTRNILDTVRTIFIWTFLTLIHYTLSPELGEPWNNWCYVQFAGFCILIFGLFTYYSVFQLPCFFYRQLTKLEQLTETPRMTPRNPHTPIGACPYTPGTTK